jgi:pimeloyl-ACP methyl ester carboxylesterase
MRSVVVMLLVCVGSFACRPAPPVRGSDSVGSTIVIVHGAWGGGWQFHKVEPLLRRAGHIVYRPTMTGLGERVHLASPDIGLSTHIEDVVKVFEFEDLDDVILVGHSYGGMVISGVAHRVPHRIKKLVYMDAFVPEHGESVAEMVGGWIIGIDEPGEGEEEAWQVVPGWVEDGELPPVDVPHPLKTLTDTIVLDNPAAEDIPAVFLLTVEAGKDTDDFDTFADRARHRGWPVVEMEGGHNPQWFQPERFSEVLLEAIGE